MFSFLLKERLNVREIKPYATVQGLRKALDNGGRFYNLFQLAEDNVVSKGELAKAAGVFSAGASAFLFLELAQQNLGQDELDSVEGLFAPELKKAQKKYRPTCLMPSQIESDAVPGKPLVTSGYLRYLEDRTQFNGMVMVPIMVGKIMIFTPIPLFERFDIWELFDNAGFKGQSAVIATKLKWKPDHDGAFRFGGLVRKLEVDAKKPVLHRKFVEVEYFSKIVE